MTRLLRSASDAFAAYKLATRGEKGSESYFISGKKDVKHVARIFVCPKNGLDSLYDFYFLKSKNSFLMIFLWENEFVTVCISYRGLRGGGGECIKSVRQ